MTEPTFPYHYQGKKTTWDNIERLLTVRGLHPEVIDRLYSICHAAYYVGVELGPGTGYRESQPDKPGFADDGNSNHQKFEPPLNAVAIDMVPSPSWNWLEANAHLHGFRTFRFVNREPWHIQPPEIPASRNYRKPVWPLNNFDCPFKRGGTPPPPTQGIRMVTVSGDHAVLDPAQQSQIRGNEDVFRVQRIMHGLFRQTGNTTFDVGNIDGDYGPRTQNAVKTFQAINQLKQDAICGPATWTALDFS